jgi:hypothetical protein
MSPMSDEKKFHIVLFNKRTKEIKVITATKFTFSETASQAYEQCRKLIEKTGEGWEIVNIYDINFSFNIKDTLY